MTTKDKSIWIEDKGAYLIVVSDNPSNRNALTMEYHELMLEALRMAASEDRITSVILVGRGGYFCAGGDLSQLKRTLDGSDHDKLEISRLLQEGIAALRACPKPVIAAVSGGAAGGGLSNMLGCDLIIAEEGASFLAAHVKIGVTPDGGLTSFLANQLPHTLASEMCLLGSAIGAETLYQHGIINRIVPKGQSETEAVALAAKLARGPGTAQSAIKTMLVAARDNTLAEQLDLERRVLAGILDEDCAREGISAFLEKRRPDFPAAEGRAD